MGQQLRTALEPRRGGTTAASRGRSIRRCALSDGSSGSDQFVFPMRYSGASESRIVGGHGLDPGGGYRKLGQLGRRAAGERLSTEGQCPDWTVPAD